MNKIKKKEKNVVIMVLFNAQFHYPFSMDNKERSTLRTEMVIIVLMEIEGVAFA